MSESVTPASGEALGAAFEASVERLKALHKHADAVVDPLGMVAPLAHAQSAWMLHPQELGTLWLKFSGDLLALQLHTAAKLTGQARRRPGAPARRRHALRRPGLVGRGAVGPAQAVVPVLHPPHPGRAVRDAGAVGQGAAPRRVLVAQVAQRHGAHQFLLQQPGRGAQGAREPRREPAARLRGVHGGHAGRHGAHDQPRALPGRREPRHHARRGGVPQPPDRADPLRAGRAAGQAHAGGDRHALDQQVLRARPDAEEEHDPLPARARLRRLHHQLEEPRRGHGRDALRRLPGRGRAPGGARGARALRARTRRTWSATASAARWWRPTWRGSTAGTRARRCRCRAGPCSRR